MLHSPNKLCNHCGPNKQFTISIMFLRKIDILLCTFMYFLKIFFLNNVTFNLRKYVQNACHLEQASQI